MHLHALLSPSRTSGWEPPSLLIYLGNDHSFHSSNVTFCEAFPNLWPQPNWTNLTTFFLNLHCPKALFIILCFDTYNNCYSVLNYEPLKGRGNTQLIFVATELIPCTTQTAGNQIHLITNWCGNQQEQIQPPFYSSQELLPLLASPSFPNNEKS